MDLNLSFLYRIFQDLINFVLRRSKKAPPVEKLQRNQKLKDELQEKFDLHPQHPLKEPIDVLLRDIDRIDEYPEENVKERKSRVAPFFKVTLRALYHQGIEVYNCSAAVEIKRNHKTGVWEMAEKGVKGEAKAYSVGRIRFDWIDHVNYEGDEYDCTPHIFCKFKNKGFPFEECRIRKLEMRNGRVAYTNDVGAYWPKKIIKKRLKQRRTMRRKPRS